jgi:hypothetical protein
MDELNVKVLITLYSVGAVEGHMRGAALLRRMSNTGNRRVKLQGETANIVPRQLNIEVIVEKDYSRDLRANCRTDMRSASLDQCSGAPAAIRAPRDA